MKEPKSLKKLRFILGLKIIMSVLIILLSFSLTLNFDTESYRYSTDRNIWILSFVLLNNFGVFIVFFMAFIFFCFYHHSGLYPYQVTYLYNIIDKNNEIKNYIKKVNFLNRKLLISDYNYLIDIDNNSCYKKEQDYIKSI